MDELIVRSTSRSSAEVSDIELRRTSTTRLVFRPMLVENPHNTAAAVKGTFVFQRKSARLLWEDIPADPLSSMKKDEGYKLAIGSSETLKLFSELSGLYKIYQSIGIPLGESEFVRAEGALVSLAELTEDQLSVFMQANASAGSTLIGRLLAWAAGSNDVPKLVDLLESLGHSALANLNAAASLRSLKEGLEVWHRDGTEGHEEFWQGVLANRSFLLENLFSWPCTVIAQKAYVGGKTVENAGGNIVDFLMRNQLTASAALVEIKTPVTRLTGQEYRNGIPNISRDLAGAIVQILSYKASLAETFLTLRRSPDEYEIFDPPCVVIIGSTQELRSSAQKRTFELLRRQLRGVEVITFDELFGRVEQLIRLLEISSTPVAE
jgi:Domain of unknown function (DUF4263)